jgi:hypothetical protein
MFEQEIEMEKRETSAIPLLLIAALILVIVGVAGYYAWQNKQVLTSQEASRVVNASLDAQGPATVHFHVGKITASVDVKPHDPNYRLLEKAGWLKIGRDQGRFTPIALTPKGATQLQAIVGVRKSDEKDGTQSYTVPVADRKLIEISSITMINPSRATVEFAWKWEANQLGEVFDASGPPVKSFNTWERATLIDKYNANFYHGNPTRVAMTLMKTDKGWQIATE